MAPDPAPLPPAAACPAACFASLPVECQANILSRLNWQDLLDVSTTCTAFHALTSDEVMWKAWCARRFAEGLPQRNNEAHRQGASEYTRPTLCSYHPSVCTGMSIHREGFFYQF